MKVGDTVMFTNEKSRYAKWFYSQIGVITSINLSYTHCTVKWCFPVKYYDSFAKTSSFELTDFSTSF